MAYTSDSIENIIKSLTIGGKTYPLGVQYADNADKADSMNVSKAIGNSKCPIYLKADGTFAQTTYSLGKTVPSNAVFTDTTYQLTLNGTTNGAGTTDLGTIYAPTSDGLPGQYLMTNGNGTLGWVDLPDFPDFSYLSSNYVTKENLEGYNNSINIVTNELDKYGFNVTNESYTASSTISYDGIYINHGNTHAWMVVGGDNILHFEAPDMIFDALNTTFTNNISIRSTLPISGESVDVDITISAEVDETDPDNKTTIIDSNLEIGSTLFLSENQVDYASIRTNGGGDLIFSGTNFEFGQSGGFVVNGPVSLKGAANTGSATNPIYIDNLGKIKPTTYTLGASVPSTAKFTDTTYKLTLNGTTKGSGSTNLGTIYAPTSAGTNGQYLKSNGTGAPTWVDLPNFSCITIGTPENPNTLDDNEVVTIDRNLEINSTIYLTNNYNDWVSISTDGGDITFNASLYEFTRPSDFVVNGSIFLKGAKNTGSTAKPIYIDADGQFKPINYDICDLVNQISQLQNRISQLENIITSYIGPIN